MRQEALEHEEAARKEMDERAKARLRREEEEQFFQERGYVRHVNRYGHVEWITPDEAKLRRQYRRKEFVRSIFKGGKGTRNVLRKWILAGMLLMAILITGAIVVISTTHGPLDPGTLTVTLEQQDPKSGGAKVYLDGVLLRETATPAKITGVLEGWHTVAVHKEGFQAVPPAMRTHVKAGKSVSAQFKLSGVPQMGGVAVTTTNLMVPYTLYVDGVAETHEPGQVIQLPVGYHVICAGKEGYTVTPQYHRVFVTREQQLRITFTFQADDKLGRLEATGADSAYLYRNGAYTGRKANGEALFLPLAKHVLEAPGADALSTEPARLEVTLLNAEPSCIAFQSTPPLTLLPVTFRTARPGAVVLLDGQWTACVTPWTATVPPGSHYVNFFRDGKWCMPDDRLLVVEAGRENSLTVDF